MRDVMVMRERESSGALRWWEFVEGRDAWDEKMGDWCMVRLLWREMRRDCGMWMGSISISNDNGGYGCSEGSWVLIGGVGVR